MSEYSTQVTSVLKDAADAGYNLICTYHETRDKQLIGRMDYEDWVGPMRISNGDLCIRFENNMVTHYVQWVDADVFRIYQQTDDGFASAGIGDEDAIQGLLDDSRAPELVHIEQTPFMHQSTGTPIPAHLLRDETGEYPPLPEANTVEVVREWTVTEDITYPVECRIERRDGILYAFIDWEPLGSDQYDAWIRGIIEMGDLYPRKECPDSPDDFVFRVATSDISTAENAVNIAARGLMMFAYPETTEEQVVDKAEPLLTSD